MTEKELKEEIIKRFKKYVMRGDASFPTNTLKKFYEMLNEEDGNDNFGEANEFWQVINQLQFQFQLDNELNEEDFDLFCELSLDNTSNMIDFLYENTDLLN